MMRSEEKEGCRGDGGNKGTEGTKRKAGEENGWLRRGRRY
jgi:hypothetical protein